MGGLPGGGGSGGEPWADQRVYEEGGVAHRAPAVPGDLAGVAAHVLAVLEGPLAHVDRGGARQKLFEGGPALAGSGEGGSRVRGQAQHVAVVAHDETHADPGAHGVALLLQGAAIWQPPGAEQAVEATVQVAVGGVGPGDLRDHPDPAGASAQVPGVLVA